MAFDPQTYLDRLGLKQVAATAEGLRALQSAQISAIPFEAIDVFLGATPDISLPVIWRRIMQERRGGWCMELNQLLGAALAAFGFVARPVMGRVRMGAAQGGARTHLAHLVDLPDGRWYVDAGFGGPAPRWPVSLETDLPQDGYRLRPDPATGERVLERQGPEGWFALLGFDEVAVAPVDVVAANHLCATLPTSPFPENLMVNIGAGVGRVSLLNRSLTVESGGHLHKRDILDEADLDTTLRAKFGIQLEPRQCAALWAKLSRHAGSLQHAV